jgi:tetratricopeptide (TPR) repeat protein
MLRKNLILWFLIALSSWSKAQVNGAHLDSLLENMQYTAALHYLKASPDLTPQKQQLKAKVEMSLSLYQEAARSWQEVIQQDSTDLSNYHELARCFQYLGNKSRAYQVYASALTLKDIPYYRYKMAQLAFDIKRYPDALKQTTTLLEKDTLQSVLRLKARTCLYADSITEGLHILYKAVERDSSDVISIAMIANQYIKEKQDKLALTYTNIVLNNDSTPLPLLKIASIAYRNLKKYTLAEQCLQQLIAQGDSTPNNLFLLGHTQYILEKYESAETYLDHANELTLHNNATMLYYLGMTRVNCYRQSNPKKYQLGIQNLSDAIDVSLPDTATMVVMYNALGKAYLERMNPPSENYSKALLLFKQAYKYQKDPESIYNIAYTFDCMRKDELAYQYYKRFLETIKKENIEITSRIERMQRFANYNYNRLKEELFMQGKIHKRKNKK